MNDKWARIIGIPTVSVIFALIYHGDVLLRFDQDFLVVTFPPFLFTLLLWEGNRYIFLKMRRQYPTHLQVSRRLVVQTLCSVVFTILITLALIYIIRDVMKLSYCKEMRLDHEIPLCLACTFFITSLYESAYFLDEWKKNIQKTEALARENIQSQLEALKNQLDPHFLFNSLNTLAALIEEDNEPAQKYLEQLSDVYRYVLLNKDRSTVTLEEELAFVESYLYLNKTRFRDNLRIETMIPKVQQKQLIAPLSLQMLVENAIKHNIISRDKPLTIRILQEENWIRVENNVQEKILFEKSTKVGLQNIVKRYSYLSSSPVEILNQSNQFSVRLPLIPA
jgi:sensor histidine kinase YesM